MRKEHARREPLLRSQPRQEINLQFNDCLVMQIEKMATRYVQDVSAQMDRVIENSRKYVI
jgi:hypothetical protein